MKGPLPKAEFTFKVHDEDADPLNHYWRLSWEVTLPDPDNYGQWGWSYGGGVNGTDLVKRDPLLESLYSELLHQAMQTMHRVYEEHYGRSFVTAEPEEK